MSDMRAGVALGEHRAREHQKNTEEYIKYIRSTKSQ